jgi:hypothetical protein
MILDFPICYLFIDIRLKSINRFTKACSSDSYEAPRWYQIQMLLDPHLKVVML